MRVNCLAPTAATRMTQDIMPPEVLALLTPESVTPGLLHLVSEDAPTRAILCAGAGVFAASHVTLTEGVLIGQGPDAPEQVGQRFDEITARSQESVPGSGTAQSHQEVRKVMAGR